MSRRQEDTGAVESAVSPDPDCVAVACAPEQTVQGEGPVWDDRRNELLRVDIIGAQVHRDRVGEDGEVVPVGSYRVPGPVGAIAHW